MTNSHIFGDKDANSQRRKREEQQVELRRQRAEELLNKKRVSAKDTVSTNTFESSKSLLFTNNIESIYKGTYDCRSLLSVEVNPPIQEIIVSGIVPRFVELLEKSFYTPFGTNPLCSKTRFEAAWVITNIASGNSDQTRHVVRLGAVPLLVKMISEDDDTLVDQAIWALGNIAGDGEESRDIIIESNALDTIIKLLGRYTESFEHIKITRNLVWLLSNLNRGRNPTSKFENMMKSVQLITKVIEINDPEIVSDCFWCLSYIIDASSEMTDYILNSSIINRLKSLLGNLVSSLQGNEFDSKIQKVAVNATCPMIRMLGNTVTGTEEQTNAVIMHGFLSLLQPIFYLCNNKKIARIRKEICWLLSNVTAGSDSQVEYVIKSDILGLLIDAVSRYELFIRKEASYGLLNLLFYCVKFPENLQRFLDNKALQALQMYLSTANTLPEIQAHILDAVRYALEAGEKIKLKTGINPVVPLLIDTKFIDDIEELQDVKNNVVSQKAYNIIITFFEGEDEIL